MTILTVHRAAGLTSYGVPDGFDLAAWVGKPFLSVRDEKTGYQAIIRIGDDVLALSVKPDSAKVDDHNLTPVSAPPPGP